jgi:hypothetical protein
MERRYRQATLGVPGKSESFFFFEKKKKSQIRNGEEAPTGGYRDQNLTHLFPTLGDNMSSDTLMTRCFGDQADLVPSNQRFLEAALWLGWQYSEPNTKKKEKKKSSQSES